MDINELNKKQLILLTLLITFVVSIATGIVTVSLMKQMPANVPQTINNIIQRTIEKVSTATNTSPAVTTDVSKDNKNDSLSLTGNADTLVPIYSIVEVNTTPIDTTLSIVPSDTTKTTSPKELGQGIVLSDVGLILVDSNILTDKDKYKVVLNKTDFEASVLKKFDNGFTILQIIENKDAITTPNEVKNIDTNIKTE
jgi:hypothetical protein